MIGLGLSAASLSALNTLLLSPHRIRIVVNILDLNHKRLADVSGLFLDGQVTIDNTAAITRSTTLSFFDPFHRMGLDSNSPADGALFIDRMLAIYYVVMKPDYTNAVTIPIFTGPITKVDRDWSVVSVEAQGKESLSLSPAWTPKTYPKGSHKVSLIRDLLASQTGETKFSLPSGTTTRSTTPLAIGNESKPWEIAKSVASGMGYQLFYDGRGTCVMRPHPRSPVWNFTDTGASASLMSKPQVGYDLSKLINAVIVKGVVVKGTKKTPLVVKRFAPGTDPLSPWAIGRNGVRRYLFTIITNDNINSTTEANAVAQDTISRGMVEAVTASFDAYPIPHLEPGDQYRIITSEFSTTATIQQMTIPLNATGKMTVGYLRNTRPNKANIRRNRA